ncbi:MAG: T9SS type A sorting domain-containing protein [candidate division KSB1 bacterium]|nr:T9SS type A sorting domain-containing protein [candidate division KSB1 bacterium]
MPTEYSISQNYPNPFNSQTRIQYSVIEPVQVQLIIYNTLGQVVTQLVNEQKTPGVYTVNWNAGSQSLESGVYFCRVQAGEFTAVRKMLHVK